MEKLGHMTPRDLRPQFMADRERGRTWEMTVRNCDGLEQTGRFDAIELTGDSFRLRAINGHARRSPTDRGWPVPDFHYHGVDQDFEVVPTADGFIIQRFDREGVLQAEEGQVVRIVIQGQSGNTAA